MRDWILGTLKTSIAQLDGALFWRMATALDAGDAERFHAMNAWLMAARESREFQREDRRTGSRISNSGQRRIFHICRAIDEQEALVDFLLTAKPDLDAQINGGKRLG